MLKSIKNFLKNLDPDIAVQAPSRINLINPLDAVEGDFWMPSVAINGIDNPLSAFAYIKEINSKSKVAIYNVEKDHQDYYINKLDEEILFKNIEQIKERFLSKFKLVYASIYRLAITNPHFWEDFNNKNIEIGVLTTIPKQSGIGGSTSIIVTILFALSNYFGLYNNFNYGNSSLLPINKDIIAEMATKVEDEDLKITAGYSDRYVISRGGLSFCSYYGKLNHLPISKEPLAVYDRIDQIYEIDKLPIIICFSGVSHESGNVHQKLREMYLKKEKHIIKSFQKLAVISWKSRFALMNHDWKLLGSYFKENTLIMNRVMKNAGFQYGIGLANNILIKLIENHPDVYAAKLTGAGGGGSVFALVNPFKVKAILDDWKSRLKNITANEMDYKSCFPSFPDKIRKELKNAKFFLVQIDYEGVKKLLFTI